MKLERGRQEDEGREKYEWVGIGGMVDRGKDELSLVG